MSTTFEADAAARERLSALADGELPGHGAVVQACGYWRESAEARAAWHAYQLIGDVLRSDDLAGDPAREANLMAALRARLATEPVVLAPQPIANPASVAGAAMARVAGGAGRRWSWKASSAVAAGVVVVAGALTLTRIGDVPTGNPAASSLAQAVLARPGPAMASSASTGPAALAREPQIFVADGQLIRDARLDRYLAAHKQFAGSTALGVPSGFLRNATSEAVGR